jgi:predicted Zn-dependent protease
MTAEPTVALPSIDDAGELLGDVLRRSPADETEIVWLGMRRGRGLRDASGAKASLQAGGTALVRVLDRGRMGSYRTGESDAGALADAVRQAIAQSRVKEPLPGLPHLPCDETPLATMPVLHDAELASWSPADAEAWLSSLPAEGLTAELQWTEATVLVANSRGLHRRARVTAVELVARHPAGPGGGRAENAARTLQAVAANEVLDRARARHGPERSDDLPAEPRAIILAPEASCALADLLNRVALSATAYSEGTSLLREHLGIQVFDRVVDVRDDGTDPAGLAFPFDLEGTAKRPVALISKGTPRTPALDQRQAARLGLPPTGCSISGDDALAMNLVVAPGQASDGDLLAAGDGGLWVGWLEGIECTDSQRLEFRALARGVRCVRGGQLAEAAPDALWRDSLLRLLSERPLLGVSRGLRLSRDGYLGGILAPAMAVAPGLLQPLEGSPVQRTKTRV